MAYVVYRFRVLDVKYTVASLSAPLDAFYEVNAAAVASIPEECIAGRVMRSLMSCRGHILGTERCAAAVVASIVPQCDMASGGQCTARSRG